MDKDANEASVEAGIILAMEAVGGGNLVKEMQTGGPGLQSWKPLWDAAVLDSFDDIDLIDVATEGNGYFRNVFRAADTALQREALQEYFKLSPFIRGLEIRIAGMEQHMVMKQVSAMSPSSPSTGCESEVTWSMCVLEKCPPRNSANEIPYATTKLEHKLIHGSDCQAWFTKVDKAIRGYMGRLRSAVLSKKTGCCGEWITRNEAQLQGDEGFIDAVSTWYPMSAIQANAFPRAQAWFACKRNDLFTAAEERLTQREAAEAFLEIEGTAATRVGVWRRRRRRRRRGSIVAAVVNAETIPTSIPTAAPTTAAPTTATPTTAAPTTAAPTTAPLTDVTDASIDDLLFGKRILDCSNHVYASTEAMRQSAWGSKLLCANGCVTGNRISNAALASRITCAEADYPHEARLAFSPLMGSQYFPPKLEVVSTGASGAKVRISCGGSKKQFTQFITSGQVNLQSPVVYESDTCCPPISPPGSYDLGCGKADYLCDRNDNSLPEENSGHWRTKTLQNGNDGCGCHRCFINGQSYEGWSPECSSAVKYAADTQPTADKHEPMGCPRSCPSEFKGTLLGFMPSDAPGFLRPWNLPLAIQRTDATACNRGLFGSNQASCSSDFTVQVLKCTDCKCVMHNNNEALRVETKHELSRTAGKHCAPWFAFVDQGMRALVGRLRASVAKTMLLDESWLSTCGSSAHDQL
jgi:hypothetical protein